MSKDDHDVRAHANLGYIGEIMSLEAVATQTDGRKYGFTRSTL